MSVKKKVHKSAVAIIPPLHIWDSIQGIRKVHDKSYVRWMPHINILYPFAIDSEFETLKPKAIQALSSIQPFTLHFNKFKYFQHGKSSSTLWLDPQEGECDEPQNLLEIESKLIGAFPTCTDLVDISKEGKFVPHLSVGQFKGKQMVERFQSQFQSSWQPLQFTVECLYFISRTDTDPFEVRAIIPLNGASLQEIRTDFKENPITTKYISGQYQIFVGGIPPSITNKDLENLFSKHCKVIQVKLITDPKTSKPKGFGFITCSGDDSSAVISALHNTNIGGRPITVRLAN